MIRIRRTRRDAESRPHQRRRQNIEQRLRPVRDQRICVTENSAGELARRQEHIEPNSSQHERGTGLGAPLDRGMMFGEFGGHSAQLARPRAQAPARN